ncbi:MAG: ATP-binding cassette domain-containing protein [Oscillospiraceae bacterium]|nr:ATP-binding cassette domain-containing protein [Oscillospiraceae bacterium]
MVSFKIENLSFTYPNRESKTLDDINFTVKRGEFVTLCGKSGCGKTTLLRLMKSSLTPFGKTEGSIYFEEMPLSSYSAGEQAAGIGFVMQCPENQIVTDKVWHELAFGLESLGHSTPEIRTRVSEMASFFGIQTWFHKNVTDLSGGQKQLLNLASVMVMQPSVLILDEPTSQLDPIAAQEFLKTLEKINRELGVTVILTEHRLEDALPISDRVIVMDIGKIIADSSPEKVGEILKNLNHDMYAALPTPMRVYGAVENTLKCPITIRDGRVWLEDYSENNTIHAELIPQTSTHSDTAKTVIEVRDVWFRYEKGSPDIIKGMNIQIKEGELIAIVGGNAAGKTTALSLISGLNTPYRGEVLIHGGTLGVLPQNPQSLFLKKTVYLDLMEILSEKKLSKEEKAEKVRSVSELCRIENLLESHPYDLSGGEQQRAALAKVLLMAPEILLLDEPTKGIDAHFKEIFADIINDLKASGVTVVMVSHDIEFCAEHADRCAMFFDGNITSCAAARDFFTGKNFYTTAANRMARTRLPKAVLAEDIILACGGNPPERTGVKVDLPVAAMPDGDKKQEPGKILPNKAPKLAKRTVTAALLILIAIPLTIFIGMFYLEDRKYYFISLFMIIEILIPFCMVFEGRKPKARELVLISVLCAIAVAGRAAFFMLPQFKPVVALVIIAGVCLGGETGFLVGAVTGFVSNFFFGQGPWTPWQMFSLGIIGFIAGVLQGKGLLRRTKASLCIFGFAMAFFIYGGIMNPVEVLRAQASPTLKMFMAAYISGAPFDLIHASSTAFFLWFISEEMIAKIERIKVKYGLIEG